VEDEEGGKVICGGYLVSWAGSGRDVHCKVRILMVFAKARGGGRSGRKRKTTRNEKSTAKLLREIHGGELSAVAPLKDMPKPKESEKHTGQMFHPSVVQNRPSAKKKRMILQRRDAGELRS